MSPALNHPLGAENLSNPETGLKWPWIASDSQGPHTHDSPINETPLKEGAYPTALNCIEKKKKKKPYSPHHQTWPGRQVNKTAWTTTSTNNRLKTQSPRAHRLEWPGKRPDTRTDILNGWFHLHQGQRGTWTYSVWRCIFKLKSINKIEGEYNKSPGCGWCGDEKGLGQRRARQGVVQFLLPDDGDSVLHAEWLVKLEMCGFCIFLYYISGGWGGVLKVIRHVQVVFIQVIRRWFNILKNLSVELSIIIH